MSNSVIDTAYTAFIDYLARDARAFAKGNGFYADYDVLNAIEHTFTSADMRFEFERVTATRLANLKELSSDDARDSWKDQWNNEVGRRKAEWAQENGYGPEIMDPGKQ